MSLKVWLPLNYTTFNMSTSDIVISGHPNSWQYGPLGRCASFNNDAGDVIYNNSTDFNYTTQNFSWAVWINKSYASKTESAMFAFTVGRADAGGYGYGLQIMSTSSVTCWFGTYTATVSGVPDDEWHHIAFVRNGETIKVYRDGTCVLNQGRSGNLPTYSEGNGLGLGCFHYTGNIYPLIGHLSDFRLYDHALSDKDVKELAQGLVCRYRMDNPYACGLTNMLSASQAKGMLSNSHFTRTALYKEDGYKFTLTYTGTGSDAWMFIRSSNLSKSNFTVGKTYIWSCKYRVNKWTSTESLKLRHACYTNDTTTSGEKIIANSSKVDGKWHLVTSSYTLTQAIYDRSDFGPLVEFYTESLKTSGTVYGFDIDIKECQIVEADAFPGWIDNSLVSNYISNSTGANLNAFPLYLNGKCKPVSGQDARGMCAYDFNQTGFYYSNGVDLRLDKMTISFWFNARSNSSQHFLVGAFTSWDNNGIGIYRDPNKNYFIGRMKGGTSSSCDIGGGPATFSFNTWNHWALTWDGSSIKIYLNGTLKNTTSYSANGACNIQALFLGNSYFDNVPASETEECAMSDFRLYGTSLSADDIKTLYQTSASVDNLGGYHSNTIYESGDTSSVRVSRCGTEFNGISEYYARCNCGFRKEPDNSLWVCICHHAKPSSSNLFSSSDSFGTCVVKDTNRYFHGKLCDYATNANSNEWEFLVIQQASNTSAIEKYRWIQFRNPNTATFSQVASGNVDHVTTSGCGYSSCSWGGIYKKNSNAYYTANNGTESNWWGAFGAWSTVTNGIPAWNGVTVTSTGFLDLYVRVDTLANLPDNSMCNFIAPTGCGSCTGLVEL